MYKNTYSLLVEIPVGTMVHVGTKKAWQKSSNVEVVFDRSLDLANTGS